MTLAQKTLSKLSVQAVSLSFQAIFQIVTLTVYARYLNPEDFGIFAIAGLIQNFAEMFSSTGISSALVQRKKIDNGHITSALIMTMLFSIFFYLVIFFSSDFIARFYHNGKLEDVLKLTSVSLIILSISGVPRSLLQRSLEFKKMMMADLIPYLLGYILLGILLAINGYGVWTLVYALLLTSVLKMLMFFYFTQIKLSFHNLLMSAKELIGYGGGITLLNLINSLAQYMDKILTGRLLSIEALGLYERIAHLVLLISKYLGNTFDSVLFPILSGIQDEPLRVRTAFLKAAELLNVIILPLSVFSVFYSDDILLLILGPAWLPAGTAFKILLFMPVIRLITRLTDSLVRSLGAVYRSALRKVLFLFAIVLGLILGARYGINGIATGVLCSVIFHYILMLTLSLSLIDVSLGRFLPIYRHGTILGLLTMMISIVTQKTAGLYFDLDFRYNLILLFVDVILYLTILYYFPNILGENMVQLLRNIVEKIPNRITLVEKFNKRLLVK